MALSRRLTPSICALLGIAAFDLPYGYYQFLRIAVTIWGIITLYKLHNQEPANKHTSIITLISGGIAILYNPLIPVHLTKDIWTILNLGSIPCILLSTYLTHSHPRPTQKTVTLNTNYG